jgi:hypothetical protein
MIIYWLKLHSGAPLPGCCPREEKMRGMASLLSATLFVAICLFHPVVYSQTPGSLTAETPESPITETPESSTAPTSESPMVQRNLFSPDRRPPSPDSPTLAGEHREAKTPPSAVQLDGVFIYGESKSALLRLKSQPHPGKRGPGEEAPASPYVTVSEGEQAGEFRVVKIDPRSVTLEKDGEVVEVKLFESNKVSPPVQAVPSTPAAGAQVKEANQQQPTTARDSRNIREPVAPNNGTPTTAIPRPVPPRPDRQAGVNSRRGTPAQPPNLPVATGDEAPPSPDLAIPPSDVQEVAPEDNEPEAAPSASAQ